MLDDDWWIYLQTASQRKTDICMYGKSDKEYLDYEKIKWGLFHFSAKSFADCVGKPSASDAASGEFKRICGLLVECVFKTRHLYNEIENELERKKKEIWRHQKRLKMIGREAQPQASRR